MSTVIKIAIPMAGYGSRMRPLTWTKAKPLISVAGRTVLDYLLEQFSTLPDSIEREFIFIVSSFQLDQIKAYMKENHPDLKVDYVVQEQMTGQSDAIYTAGDKLSGPLITAFSDTLIDPDLTNLFNDPINGVIWVKEVDDPSRFGVVSVKDKLVAKLVEKPTEFVSNLAVVGFYYFKEGEDLLKAIEEQKYRKLTQKNEYFLADAINIWLEGGRQMRAETVDVWLDAGIPEALLDTNRYLLRKHFSNNPPTSDDYLVVPPVYVHPTAKINASVIGPYVSIGKNCVIDRACIQDSILEEKISLSNTILTKSLLGKEIRIEGRPETLNLGDNAKVSRT